MRVFIGIDLPIELKLALYDFQSEIKNLGVGGAFKSQENFHITLEFLGEIDPAMKSALVEVLSEVSRKYKPFLLNIGGIGAFPSFRRPHTLWTSVGGNLLELNKLRDNLHLELANKGFPVEMRQFTPHLTIVSHPKPGIADLSGIRTKKLGEFLVTEIILFESKTVERKRIYESLHIAGLERNDI
ncbi:MAG: RNA 2',3'-cyclic phosphodiesterase [Negativicutes bacterium]